MLSFSSFLFYLDPQSIYQSPTTLVVTSIPPIHRYNANLLQKFSHRQNQKRFIIQLSCSLVPLIHKINHTEEKGRMCILFTSLSRHTMVMTGLLFQQVSLALHLPGKWQNKDLAPLRMKASYGFCQLNVNKRNVGHLQVMSLF